MKGAYFGAEDEEISGRGRAEWCSSHRLEGHANVRDKRCQYPEVAPGQAQRTGKGTTRGSVSAGLSAD
jgi:hypothetical protein